MAYSIENTAFKYKNAYYKFPQSLKTFIGSLYGKIPLSIRFGHAFTTHRDIVEKFESNSTQYQMDFIYNKTLETIIFAEENIPYYKKVFQEHGISSKDFKILDDLKKFPTLNKQTIINNLDSIYTDIVEKPVKYLSGGSLFIPAIYYLPETSRSKEKAYTNYILSQVGGYQYRDKTLLLQGREVDIPEKDIYWEYEPIDNYFLLSNTYINSPKFPLMFSEAKKFKPKYILGYPSAVLSFVKQSILYGYQKLEIKGVMLFSETLYPNELKIIGDFFGVDILAHYGHTERIVVAYKINDNHYNFMNSYGVPRIIDNEIVATSFDNFVMPFINYQTGDHVAGDIEYYDKSDIANQVQNIEGRTQDFLVSKDKRLVSIISMNRGLHLPVGINNIQYLQNKEGKVTVLLEGKGIDTEKVRSDMSQLVRDSIDFDVKVVGNIEKSSRGKRILCKQLLDIEAIRTETAQ